MNKKQSSLALRLVRGFAKFWWDFLVGDTPELSLSALATIGVVALISVNGHDNVAAVVVLPVMAVAALSLSVRRAYRKARRSQD